MGIKILKNKLSEYVRLAASGESVLVTDRGRVVAQLGPLPPHRADSLPDVLLAQAVREGLVTPAALPPGEPRPVMTLRQLLAELDESRADR